MGSTLPQTFGEAVNCLVTAVKVERHIRGEPDIRVEYLHQFGEAVRRAFEEFAEQRGLAGDEETAAFAELLDRALEEALGPEGTALALRD